MYKDWSSHFCWTDKNLLGRDIYFSAWQEDAQIITFVYFFTSESIYLVSPLHLTGEKLMLKYHGVSLSHSMRSFKNPKGT